MMDGTRRSTKSFYSTRVFCYGCRRNECYLLTVPEGAEHSFNLVCFAITRPHIVKTAKTETLRKKLRMVV